MQIFLHSYHVYVNLSKQHSHAVFPWPPTGTMNLNKYPTESHYRIGFEQNFVHVVQTFNNNISKKIFIFNNIYYLFAVGLAFMACSPKTNFRGCSLFDKIVYGYCSSCQIHLFSNQMHKYAKCFVFYDQHFRKVRHWLLFDSIWNNLSALVIFLLCIRNKSTGRFRRFNDNYLLNSIDGFSAENLKSKVSLLTDEGGKARKALIKLPSQNVKAFAEIIGQSNLLSTDGTCVMSHE